MVNFQNGKIYKLCSNQTDDIYVGSTCCKLSDRLKAHKAKLKVWTNCNEKQYYTSFEILQHPDYYIELIEDYPCETKQELLDREGYYIELLPCVNKVIQGRTKKETQKAWRDKNKDVINKKAREMYKKNNLKEIEKSREYYKKNKNKRKVKIICECGSTFRKDNKKRHEQTKKHLSFIKNI